MKPPSSRRGYSLIELVVAVGVLAVGLLAIYASLTYSLNATRHAERISQAVALNRQILDLVRSRQLVLNEATKRPVNDAPFQNDIAGDLPFERRVEVSSVSNNASLPESRLRRIRVTIYWTDGGVERSMVFEAFQRQP